MTQTIRGHNKKYNNSLSRQKEQEKQRILKNIKKSNNSSFNNWWEKTEDTNHDYWQE